MKPTPLRLLTVLLCITLGAPAMAQTPETAPAETPQTPATTETPATPAPAPDTTETAETAETPETAETTTPEAAAPPPAENRHIDVYLARKIITMNPSWPEARVVAVRNGEILGVANRLSQLQPWLRDTPHTVRANFADKVLMPGFIDPHQHFLLGPLTLLQRSITYNPTFKPYGPPTKALRTRISVMERLAEYHAEMPPEEPLIAWGFDVLAHGGHVERSELDAISTERPIYVWDASVHNIYLNSAALAQTQLPEDFSAKHPTSNIENGQFIGTVAMLPVAGPLMNAWLQPERLPELLQFSVDSFRRGGITTTADLALGMFSRPLEEAAIPAMLNRPDVPMRAALVVSSAAYPDPDSLAELRKSAGDKVFLGGVKFIIDDAFLSLTMQAGPPGYIDGHEGVWQIPEEQLYEAILPWWRAGFRIHVHSNGQLAQEGTLNVLQKLQEAHPRFDHRFTFEHVGMLTADQAERMAALGAQASVNIWYPWLRGALNREHIGIDRAETVSPLATLQRAGVRTTLHTDLPVAPPLPLHSVWHAVNRLDQDGRVLGPAERIDIHEALRMITIEAARVLGIERRVGSIQAGKLADFTVLEEDPYKVEKRRIRDIEIWGTVVGGKIYPASEIAPPALAP
ncbi:MAG: amidohydrolase [Gammaproteobacteria bacterium AqS3]|nr:amidohydrolase [Gammaproteobacteria bacterium AqS3]